METKLKTRFKNLLKKTEHNDSDNLDEVLVENTHIDHKPFPFWIIGAVIVVIIVGEFLGKYSFLFRASLVGLPSTQMSGTVFPVKKIPIWTELTDAERSAHYDNLPASKLMDLPEYDIAQMKAGLTWQKDNADQRNIYISYPVPYMGNYQLDGSEYSGSHPGIDIKIPEGTPIHSIANGIVYKVGNLTTGFGKSVSIAHINIEDPENPGQTTSIVSTYAHLSQTSVKEGDKVSKDQVIGKSGNTGFSTAPHLHFQIDRSSAPFIPYWPFAWADITAAGYNSTFDAVRNGVGKQNALSHTIHPVEFIEDYKDYSINIANTKEQNLVASANENIVVQAQDYVPTKVEVTTPEVIEYVPEKQEIITETESVTETTPVVTPEVTITPAPVVINNNYNKKLTVNFETDRTYVPGKAEKVIVTINEANLVASSQINLSSTLKSRATVTPNTLSSSDFTNNSASVLVETDSEYPFKLIAEGSFGTIKSDSLRPEVFEDVSADYDYAVAIRYLKENNVVQGYEDGTFKPNNTLNRAESLKIILEANNYKIKTANHDFSDVVRENWFHNYVATAFKNEIVQGYEDGSFKPGNTVTRAEFLKMAITTKGITAAETHVNPYSDIDKNLWFAKYFAFAKSHNLLRTKSGGLAAPHEPITRGEAANVIYELSKINVR